MNAQSRHSDSAKRRVCLKGRMIGGLGTLALLVLLPIHTGCRGGGRLELASLSFKSVDPPAPRVTAVKLRECYWWTDDADQVWIAVQSRWSPWFNPKFRLELQMSLVLEKLPAGAARNYELRQRALCGRIRFGPWESRLVSQVGIAAAYRESGNRLHCSMRVQATRVTSQLLGSWGQPVPYLVLGDFTAVPDEQRGRAIALLTESGGWDRKPTSRPADDSSPNARPHP